MANLLSTGDIARRLGWSIVKVRTLCESGRLPAVNTSTGDRPRWHVRESDLEHFLTPGASPSARNAERKGHASCA